MKNHSLSKRCILILFLTFMGTTFLNAAESNDFDAAERYQGTCFACHGTGQAHAPIVGDVIEWEIRLEKGLDTLVQSTINGLNGMMPARGLCTDCSDEQLKAIIDYMLDQSK